MKNYFLLAAIIIQSAIFFGGAAELQIETKKYSLAELQKVVPEKNVTIYEIFISDLVRYRGLPLVTLLDKLASGAWKQFDALMLTHTDGSRSVTSTSQALVCCACATIAAMVVPASTRLCVTFEMRFAA